MNVMRTLVVIDYALTRISRIIRSTTWDLVIILVAMIMAMRTNGRFTICPSKRVIAMRGMTHAGMIISVVMDHTSNAIWYTKMFTPTTTTKIPSIRLGLSQLLSQVVLVLFLLLGLPSLLVCLSVEKKLDVLCFLLCLEMITTSRNMIPQMICRGYSFSIMRE